MALIQTTVRDPLRLAPARPCSHDDVTQETSVDEHVKKPPDLLDVWHVERQAGLNV
jgi:hypothetical protein